MSTVDFKGGFFVFVIKNIEALKGGLLPVATINYIDDLGDRVIFHSSIVNEIYTYYKVLNNPTLANLAVYFEKIKPDHLFEFMPYEAFEDGHIQVISDLHFKHQISSSKNNEDGVTTLMSQFGRPCFSVRMSKNQDTEKVKVLVWEWAK